MKIFNYQFSMINSRTFRLVVLALIIFMVGMNVASIVNAQESVKSVDITKSSFKLLICDGPEELRHYNPATNKIEEGFTNDDFIPCDFRGLMMQLQHFINIAMVLGVLVALGGLLWAGALYISGAPEKIKQAHKIFPSIFWGFIIMLSAWFIVYQILEWLTGPNAKSFGVLLGL